MSTSRRLCLRGCYLYEEVRLKENLLSKMIYEINE